jgi:hypothetical protein
MDIFTAFGLSASAGLNAYIPLLVIAFLDRFTNLITLNPPWDTLSSWWVIGVLIVLSLIEFFADKAPAVNHINDILQTIIRPAAGAIVFAASAQVISDVHPVLSMILGLLVAGGVHAVKAIAVRPAITATTGGVGNTPVSILEDILSTVLSIISVILPILIAGIILLITALVVWLLWQRANRQRYSGVR